MRTDDRQEPYDPDRPRLDATGGEASLPPDTPDPRIPRAPHHGEEPGVANHIGEAAGGLSGALTGAAIGSVGGPAGTIIGGIAGAVGGWWAGRAIAEAAANFTDEEDEYYRGRYETSEARPEGRPYEDVRPAYHLGHLASLNPDYAGREFEEIEPDLRQGWQGGSHERLGPWDELRPFAREAYADASSRRIIGPDAERPITPVRDDAPNADALDDDASSGVELSEAADPRALGDNTSVTGYAGGLTDESEDSRGFRD